MRRLCCFLSVLVAGLILASPSQAANFNMVYDGYLEVHKINWTGNTVNVKVEASNTQVKARLLRPIDRFGEVDGVSSDGGCTGIGTRTITCPRTRMFGRAVVMLNPDSSDIVRATAQRDFACSVDSNASLWVTIDRTQTKATPGPWLLVGGHHDDRLAAPGHPKTKVLGCSGNDDLRAYDGSKVYGGGGRDTVNAYGNGTMVYGQAIRDIIDVFEGAVAFGGPGSDLITASSGSRAYGGPGADFMGQGNPNFGRPVVLSGEQGNDQIRSSPDTSDTLIGGPGNDVLLAGQQQRGTRTVGGVPYYGYFPGAPDRLLCGAGRDRVITGRNSTYKLCEAFDWLPYWVNPAGGRL